MLDFWRQFFDLGQHQQLPLEGDYDIWLVLLSYVIAFIASLSALKILDRAYGYRSKVRQRGWVAATAVIAGIGVWSMHFIGMLAFELPISVSHSVGLTLFSMLPAIIGNFIAYSLHLYAHQLQEQQSLSSRKKVVLTLTSGAILGAGIGLMHYLGMEAMVLAADLRYHPGWFAGSIIVAVVLGVLAMSTYRRYRAPQNRQAPAKRIRLLTALIIAAAITGMHYVAMLAARFYEDSTPLPAIMSSSHQQHYWLIYAIAIAVAVIAIVAWLSSVVDHRLQLNQRQIQQSGKKIRELAYNDTLTGLPNRRSLLEYLNSQQEEVPDGECLALFLIDIDKFKVLNNTLGPTLGDTLLQSVTHRLERLPLDIHMVARPSSNEFAAVARISCDGNPAKAQSAIMTMAKHIQQRLEEPYSLRDYRHRCSMSIGMTLLNKQNKSADEVLVQAALALAEAKRCGLGQIQLFHPQMADTMEHRVRMESDLRWAIENNQQLELYLQPQLNRSRQVIGAEALIRWQHPKQGFISPAEFIPLAEETGLIVSLGDWVNQQACKIIKQWQQLGMAHLVLSINVSSPQFQQLDFVDKLNDLIRQYDVPPGSLKIELTESVLMQNVDEVIGKINELKQLGIQFALDDFGTGYSSLSYLMKLPFDLLKIDVSFVREMLSSPEKDAIVRTIVQLSHNLGLSVVAEGVETEQHFQHLQMLGCDSFQGFLFSKPVPAVEFQQQTP
ncbi:putative bifunctional diguanylate cyclase/phosphodiesterase [Idiomarina seosinensis]|uniref:cyclic-guanylate-specific phosphodiesterase n=1 Tax=Idiomarina seosinensis TaxID=281739 RepID=A0A432ZI55_9GAMM|nr:EAL domain-containing protein [Idiomarina seosinensis]RUO77715.1 hypothetical protein CWI81_04350 [Idiomarina seosinensis]